jgi:hypothetical protein
MDNPTIPTSQTPPSSIPTEPYNPGLQTPATPPFPTNPITNMPPPTVPPPNIVSEPPPTQKSKRFTFFVVFSIVILIAIWGVVGYLYYQNKNTEGETSEEIQNTSDITPTPGFSASEIQISNGNVSRITSFGETQTLVNKEDHPNTGITGFARVVVSPDNTLLCFESIAPATAPALYVSNIDGSNISEVARDRNTCTWALDSKNIYYVNAPLGQQAINILHYSLDTKIEKNLTESKHTESQIRQYEISGASDTSILCRYDVINASGSKLSESNCEINTQTGEVSDISTSEVES